MNQPEMHSTPRSISWQINGLHMAGLSWGDPNGKPLLALHGWLDNAASFTPLAPLLAGHHVVALDLTGHGRSAHRSADATYQIWDDLPEILGVLEELNWPTFDLIGHSRGAIIATIFAATYAERINHLVLLDAATPPDVPAADFPKQMRNALQDKLSLGQRQHKKIDTIEKAIAARCHHGLQLPAARLLAERNLEPWQGGFRWSTDRRLQSASPVKLNSGQIDAVLDALDMPTMLLLAKEATHRPPSLLPRIRQHVANLAVAEFTGGHHFHMEGDVPSVARSIIEFLSDIKRQAS